MIPVLKDRYHDMPNDILYSKDVMKVDKFLKENVDEIRSRSDAMSITFAEAEVATKLENLNTEADKILKPLLAYYLSFRLGEHKITVDTIHKLKAAIQKATKKSNQIKVIKRLLSDL